MRVPFTTNKKIKILLIILNITALMAVSFLIGLHLHGTFSLWIYEGRMRVENFACYGHTNLWETFQLDCYKKKISNTAFKMSKHLKCNGIIMSGINEDNYSQNTRQYLSAMTIKINSQEYSIEIDPSRKILTRANTGGEVAKGPFAITQNDESVLSAYRKAYLGRSFFGYEHEKITILKKSGKGVITHFHTGGTMKNAEGIGTTFIQCESQ